MARNSNGIERWRGEVTESLKDIRKNQDEQWEAIQRLGDRFEAALKEHAHADEARYDDLDKQVNIISKAHSRLAGKVTVYAIIAGAAISAAAYKLFG